MKKILESKDFLIKNYENCENNDLAIEKLEKGIQDIIVLADDEALLLKAIQLFTDSDGVQHIPGEK